ncbi:hypothetical protein [Dankookia sp. P2]|uniref:hypothetical protein n=1 Tax=Dankookia sp. P2 TaxID=3423955 RepID=UPI003D67F96F
MTAPPWSAASPRSSPCPVRLFDIRFGDKSNAWNQYVHALAPAASMHVFVDGYAMVTPGAIRALAGALADNPQAHAAAALPSSGRSAPAQRAAMRRSPSLHGSLHALRGGFLDRIRAAGIRLPVGLYRGDGLVGSLVVHDLDALADPWDTSRIALAEAATWKVAPLSLLRPRDLRRLWNRRVQQARGSFEDAALKSWIYSANFTGLPSFADCMLAEWLKADPAALRGRTPFPRLAHARLAIPRAPSADLLEPTVLPIGPEQAPSGAWRRRAEGASPPLPTGNPA